MTYKQEGDPSLKVQKLPRVLWLINGEEVGGVRTAALNLLGACRQAGWEVAAVSLAEGELSSTLRDDGVTVYEMAMGVPPGLGGSALSRLQAVWTLENYARRAATRAREVIPASSFDVLHLQWPNHLPVAGAMGKAIGAKVVWEMPNALGRSYSALPSKLLYGWWMRRASALALANSAYTAETLRSPLARAQVFHLGVDSKRFDPSSIQTLSREELGVPAEAPLAIIAARLVKDKGQEQMVRAFRKALDAEPSLMESLHLAILGGPLDSPDGASLRDTIDRCNLNDPVHLLGHSNQPQCALATADVVLNTRLTAEPFGLTIVEAMMLRKPVLAHALGGPSETVTDGVTGWHMNAPSVEAFADGLIRAMRDRNRWPEMGERAREIALERFSLEAQFARYRDALDRFL